MQLEKIKKIARIQLTQNYKKILPEREKRVSKNKYDTKITGIF